MDTENKKEDNRLLKIFKLIDKPEGFSDGFGVPEERLQRIYREIKAVKILNDDCIDALIQITKMYNDPHEIVYAVFLFGRIVENDKSGHIVMHGGRGSIDDLKDLLDKLTGDH